jgi:hypothetical protein
MGLASKIIVIGKLKHMPEDVLDYSLDFYQYINPETKVFGTIYRACTSAQSRELATLCGCRVWDFDKHKLSLEQIELTQLTSDVPYHHLEEISRHLHHCLSANMDVWFLPEG